MAEFHSKIKTIEWVENYSKMVDQTLLPYEFKYVNITGGQQMYDAIKTMIVRGAPAIGVAGAHGVALYAQELAKENLLGTDVKTLKVQQSSPTATPADLQQSDMVRHSALSALHLQKITPYRFLLTKPARDNKAQGLQHLNSPWTEFQPHSSLTGCALIS